MREKLWRLTIIIIIITITTTTTTFADRASPKNEYINKWKYTFFFIIELFTTGYVALKFYFAA